MSDTQHTAGPWHIVDERNEHDEPQQSGLFVTSGHGGADAIAQIVRQGVPWPCAEGLRTDAANASLIAAAPELFEACEEMIWFDLQEGETSNEQFERIAERFKRDTGMLAPSKSQAAALCGTPTHEERVSAYEKWLAVFRARVHAAIAKAKTKGEGRECCERQKA